MRTLLLSLAVMAGLPAAAHADAIIFNQLGTGASNSNRTAGNAPLGVVNFAQTTTIDRFGVYDAMSGAGNVTFLIFDQSGDLLYQSAAKAFAGDGGTTLGQDSYKVSDVFSFTFVPTVTYEIGATTNVTTGYYISPNPVTQNGITVNAGNDNVSGTTAYGVTLCCSTGLVFYANTGAAVGVPEPASMALLGFGITGLTAVGRARRKA